MADTNIEWTDKAWNPVTGCTKVSAGCKNCYAEGIDRRFNKSHVPWTVKSQRESGKPAVTLHPERLGDPLKWKKPKRIFVNSISDLFHEDVSLDFIAQVFGIMAQANWHIFQVLTKRHERLEELAHEVDWPSNVHLGVSVENQKAAEERIPLLLQTPAAVRFLSVEPMLGPVNLTQINYSQLLRKTMADFAKWAGYDVDEAVRFAGNNARMDVLNGFWFDGWDMGEDSKKLDWVICGGESGNNARPMEVEWLESIVVQCQEAGVPVFVKQDSGRWPGQQGHIPNRFWIREFPHA